MPDLEIDRSKLIERVEIVDSLREAAPLLRRPFTPEAVRFKIQTVWGGNSGATLVSYIDARVVIERLNAVVPHLWATQFQPRGDKHEVCYLTIDGVTRSDVGESSKGFGKDVVSDALKRAAVQFGVGVSVYALAQIRWPRDKWMAQGALEQKKTLVLTPRGHDILQAGYLKWLNDKGVKRFGLALDHGDEFNAQPLDDEPPLDAPHEEPAEQVQSAAAEAYRREARELYDEAGGRPGGRVMTPKQFGEALRDAGGSEDSLEAFVIRMRVEAGAVAA